MTPDEIVKALKLCAGDRCCDGCIEEQSVRHWQIVMREAAGLIESMQAQLAASQHRERAAVEDLEYACGSSGEFELRSICDICRRKQTDGTCPTQCEMNSLAASNKWQWRGLRDAD